MAENSKIEWCDHTVNLWWGCAKVHTGCKNCYADALSKRFGDDVWGEDKSRKRIKSAFKDLNRYQKQAQEQGIKFKIFCGSMMDIFENSKPLMNPDGNITSTHHLRMKLFFRIFSRHYDNLIFLFLTKRPENVAPFFSLFWQSKSTNKMWFGASISDQETADQTMKKMKAFKGFNTFLSVEPQVGFLRIDLTNVDWVIQGGESGPKKRPFNITWAENMKIHCEETNTPYFFKQIDKIQAIPEHLNIKQFPKF